MTFAFTTPRRFSRRTGATTDELTAGRLAFEKSGMRGFWQHELQADLDESSRRPYFPSEAIAEDYLRLGEKDKAFEFLEKAYQDRSHDMAFIKVEPMFSSLHMDGRFQDLLRRMNLPQ